MSKRPRKSEILKPTPGEWTQEYAPWQRPDEWIQEWVIGDRVVATGPSVVITEDMKDNMPHIRWRRK